MSGYRMGVYKRAVSVCVSVDLASARAYISRACCSEEISQGKMFKYSIDTLSVAPLETELGTRGYFKFLLNKKCYFFMF